ncbi:MAG: beta-propeller domain-containing protein [Lachnospiraceae bacterium]|nr:beta-propeller domain-containing protein [Lachnospiraceae bacterium]
MKNGLKTIGSIMLNEDNDKDENNSYYVEMCIKDQQLILFEQVGWKYYYDLSYTDEYDEEKSKATTNVIIYNIEDKENPVFEKKIEQSGCYKSAKVKDDYLYFFTDYTTYRSNVPKVEGEEFNDAEERVILKEDFSASLIASIIDLKEKKVTDKIMIDSGAGLLYINENRIYSILSIAIDGEELRGIVELEYLENKIDYIGFTKIDEYLNEQTDMDERIGACRFLRSYGDGMLLGIGYDLDEESGDRKSVRLTMFDIKDPTKVKEIASIELSDCYYFAEEENAVFVSEDKNLIETLEFSIEY